MSVIVARGSPFVKGDHARPASGQGRNNLTRDGLVQVLTVLRLDQNLSQNVIDVKTDRVPHIY